MANGLTGILNEQAKLPRDIGKGFGGPLATVGEGMTSALSSLAGMLPNLELPKLPGGTQSSGLQVKNVVRSFEDSFPAAVPKVSEVIPALGGKQEPSPEIKSNGPMYNGRRGRVRMITSL